MALVGFNMAVAGGPGEVHTSQKNELGARATDGKGKEYVYLKGATNLAANMWVSYDETYTAVLLDTDVAASLVGPIAVATAAVDAATEYGWFQICGEATAACDSTIADNGKIYATSGAGIADDAASLGNQVHGAWAREAGSAQTGTATKVQIFYPFIGVTDDDQSA